MKHMKLMERLRGIRLEKERVAVSLLCLSSFVVLYASAVFSAPAGWRPAFTALALCYGLAFFALASQWFWARWFASGLAWSGTTLGLVSLVMLGWHPILALYGGLHGLVLGMLSGPHMVARFEMQAPWRERYTMDEFAVARLGRVVTRTSVAMPSLILWALAPREGQGLWLITGLAMACGMAGLSGILRLRTWGVFGLGVSAAAAMVGAAAASLSESSLPAEGWVRFVSWAGILRPGVLFSAILLIGAIAPMAGALRRAWRS
jgi:hypothetical protein